MAYSGLDVGGVIFETQLYDGRIFRRKLIVDRVTNIRTMKIFYTHIHGTTDTACISIFKEELPFDCVVDYKKVWSLVEDNIQHDTAMALYKLNRQLRHSRE